MASVEQQPANRDRWWAILKYLSSAILVLLAGDMLMRLVFFSYNAGGGWEFDGADVPLAMVVGLRFDLATIAAFNGLILILMALPFGGRSRAMPIWNALLVLLHLPVLFLNGVDVVYYGFASKRMSHELFSGGKEATNFGMAEILPYWWLILMVLLLAAGQWWLLRRAARSLPTPAPTTLGRKVLAWATPVVVAALLLLAFRGGFQSRPLRPANAFVTPSAFLGNLSLNSAYTVIQSMDIGNEAAVNLMPMSEAIALARTVVRNDFDGPFESDEYPLLRSSHFEEPERHYNVVILIIESLNANKLGCINGKPLTESLTPNLDTLARRGRLYTNFSSNGARSVQSLPAILNSTPDIFERPLIGSSFETNQQWGIGNILAARGYDNSFVCGGPNGTMGFDAFSKVSGFAHYFGQGDYDGADKSNAGNWGLHDHPALEWLTKLQASFPQPFLNVWFSISNHFPFDLPLDCPVEIANSTLSPMDKTVKYTDWALGQYFAENLRKPWAANTIFMITGDHCFYYEGDPDRGDVQNVAVPLLILGPGVEAGVDDRVGSHISMMPTLIELMRLKTRYAGLGVSLMSKQNESYGITGLMGIESFVRKHRYYSTTFEHPFNCHAFQDGKWAPDEQLAASAEGQEMDRMLRAIYQVASYIRRNGKQNLPKGMAD